MNDRQRAALGVAALVVLLTGLMPPWRLTVREGLPENVSPHTSYTQHEVAAGHALLFAPPREAGPRPGVQGTARVDVGLLLAEWAVAGGAAALAAAIFPARARGRG